MDHSELSKILLMLDIPYGKNQEARSITVLRAVIQSTEESSGSCTFSEIYKQLATSESELQVSKAWVHRILKSLVDDQLIRLEVPDSIRKNYIANVRTVASGLETLKERKGIVLSEKLTQLRNQIESFKEIECGFIAQELVEELTGQKQILSSRFLRGVEELNRVLKYNIHAAAKKGDIIRMSMMWLGPFGQGMMSRSMKYFESASQGVETRWLANASIFAGGTSPEQEIPLEIGMAMMFKIAELMKQGHKIDVRVYVGPQTYNASMLNTDRIAMVISDNPLTATYVTKDFNPDLIEDAVRSFDLTWDKAISLFNPDLKVLEETGMAESSFIGKIHQEFRREMESKEDKEHGET